MKKFLIFILCAFGSFVLEAQCPLGKWYEPECLSSGKFKPCEKLYTRVVYNNGTIKCWCNDELRKMKSKPKPKATPKGVPQREPSWERRIDSTVNQHERRLDVHDDRLDYHERWLQDLEKRKQDKAEEPAYEPDPPASYQNEPDVEWVPKESSSYYEEEEEEETDNPSEFSFFLGANTERKMSPMFAKPWQYFGYIGFEYRYKFPNRVYGFVNAKYFMSFGKNIYQITDPSPYPEQAQKIWGVAPSVGIGYYAFPILETRIGYSATVWGSHKENGPYAELEFGNLSKFPIKLVAGGKYTEKRFEPYAGLFFRHIFRTQ